MAYQGYSDQPAVGKPSPYGQTGNPYDEDTSYNGNPYAQGQYDARPGQNNYEMSNMNSNDPNRILNECKAIDSAVDNLDAQLQRLKATQSASASATDPKTITPALDQETQELLSAYRKLVDRMKRIKQDKDSGNPRNAPQVGRVDRKVKTSMNNFQKADSEYRQKLQSRMERDYRIVRPDASDAEVREAVQDPSQQVFSQALVNSDRRGEAQTVASQVRTRHAAIQKIEEDMLELAQMFQDLDALVVQQEAPVAQIEQRGEEVRDHVTEANKQLDGAVTKARAARKKKWICLGIAAAVLVVIIIIIAIIVAINNSKNNNTAKTTARLLMTL